MTGKKILTKDLLKSKLSDWVLSKDLVTKLGLNSEDEAKIKRELLSFEEEGVIKRDGAKKGLKFKYCNPTPLEGETEVKEEESIDTVAVQSNIESYIKQKTKDVSLASKHKTLREMLQFLEHSSPDEISGITSYTLSVKRLSDTVVVRMYSGILPISEMSLTLNKFSKLVKDLGGEVHE